MAKLQPENAASFESNAAEFESAMESIELRVEALADSSIHYFEAHPLAALLFAELGFENLTPEGFAEAEEAELEPSVAIVAEAQELIREYRLTFIENNCQNQIQKARNIWSAGLNKYAAERAVAIIGNIHHTPSCKAEVNQLMKEISAKLQSDVEYLRELRSQQLQWEKEQERMRLASEEAKRKEMIGLLKTYYRSRPKRIYNTRFLFWR